MKVSSTIDQRARHVVTGAEVRYNALSHFLVGYHCQPLKLGNSLLADLCLCDIIIAKLFIFSCLVDKYIMLL